MISIVIPAYNEEKYISRCLESLTKQTTSRQFEVIVVDNASIDATAEIAASFTSKLPLRVIREHRKGRGPARHTGFQAAKGEIILSADADVVLPPHWIDIMVKGFSDPDTVGITGTCYITDQSWLSNTVFNIVQPFATHLHRIVFGEYWVCGSNGGIRKEAYLRTGGFNLDLNSQEDTQLSFLLQKQGKIILVKNSKVETSGRRFSRGIVLGLLEYVRSFTERFLLRKKKVYLRDAR